MSVQISIDPVSFKKLDKRFKLLGKHYPEETYRAIVKILFDMKLLAQRKLKKDDHIVTSRLRNSIFVKTPGQKFASRSGNQKRYSDNKGKGFNADLNIRLKEFEGAIGTNVQYAGDIEFGRPARTIVAKNAKALAFRPKGSTTTIFRKRVFQPALSASSFIEYAAKNVDVNKRFRQIAENARRKIK